jgi:mRNA interferase MazF
MNAPLWDVPVRRGQIIMVSLDPAVSPEQNKVRPCVVVSNDGANDAALRTGNAMITIVPSAKALNRSGRERPYQTLIGPEESGLPALSTAQCEQVRSVSVRRVVRIAGVLSYEVMARIDEALRVQLAL